MKWQDLLLTVIVFLQKYGGWAWIEGSHTTFTHTGVHVPFRSNRHQSLPEPNQVSFVPYLNQRNIELVRPETLKGRLSASAKVKDLTAFRHPFMDNYVSGNWTCACVLLSTMIEIHKTESGLCIGTYIWKMKTYASFCVWKTANSTADNSQTLWTSRSYFLTTELHHIVIHKEMYQHCRDKAGCKH